MQLKQLSRFLLAIGIFFIAAFLGSFLADWLLKALGSPGISEITALLQNDFPQFSITNARNFRWSQGLANLITFALPALLFPFMIKYSHKEFLRTGRFSWDRMAEAVLLLAVLIPLLSGLVWWNEQVQFPEYFKAAELAFKQLEELNNRIYEQMLRMEHASDLWISILVMAVIPALGEELFFRGVLYRIFRDWTGKAVLAVLATSLIFALIHLQIFKLAPMLLLGLLLGALRWWSGSIWPSVVVHFLNNFMAVLGAWIANKDESYSFLDKDYVFPASVQWISGVLFILLAFRAWMNRKQEMVPIDETESINQSNEA